MNLLPTLEQGIIEALSYHLSIHLTHPKISHLLKCAKIEDNSLKMPKYVRLYNAFACYQNSKQTSNGIIVFVKKAYPIETYVDNKNKFSDEIAPINKILALIGLNYQEDGKMHRIPKAATLTEISERFQRLKDQLKQRNVHDEVLKFAKQEIVDENYFHLVLEAMKSITSRLRLLSGTTVDGTALVRFCFESDTSSLIINPWKTESEKGEQRGFCNLLIGMYGTFRNPAAHEAKIEWTLSEIDALDILSTISFVHRKLDNTKKRIKNL